MRKPRSKRSKKHTKKPSAYTKHFRQRMAGLNLHYDGNRKNMITARTADGGKISQTEYQLVLALPWRWELSMHLFYQVSKDHIREIEMPMHTTNFCRYDDLPDTMNGLLADTRLEVELEHPVWSEKRFEWKATILE